MDYLPMKKLRNGKRGATNSTIARYKTVKNKIIEFEKYRNKKIFVKDVGLKFSEDFEKYLTTIDKLSVNTTGRYIKFVKTVCLWATNSENISVNPKLSQIKGFSEKAFKVFLTIDELEAIENTPFTREALENAKDWLIIGCYIGQRVSDLLTLNNDNLIVRTGLELIELTQQKTGKLVSIPLHPKVKEILTRNNGNFPTKISAQKFNKHLKDLCKLAKIDQPTEGAKFDEKTKRKVKGTYPKYELITSHVCRRSFASNFYGEMPTSLLMSITAHSTETQFLEYIGKTSNDYAIQIAEYWSKEQLQAKGKTQMTVLKQAN
jgi:integrase